MKVDIGHISGERRKEVTLKAVAKLANATNERLAQRDAAIRLASSEGASLRELADAAGMSHMTIKRILERDTSD